MNSEQSGKYLSLGILVCIVSALGVVLPVLLHSFEAVVVLLTGESVVEAWVMMQAILQSCRSVGVIIASFALFPFGIAGILEGLIASR